MASIERIRTAATTSKTEIALLTRECECIMERQLNLDVLAQALGLETLQGGELRAAAA